MQFSNIKDLLGTYRERLLKVDDERKSIIDTISHVSGVQVQERALSIKNNIVRITTDPVSKNQIFIYKQRILDELAKNSPKHIFDIV